MYTGILILGPEGSNINIDSNLDICVFMIHPGKLCLQDSDTYVDVFIPSPGF